MFWLLLEVCIITFVAYVNLHFFVGNYFIIDEGTSGVEGISHFDPNPNPTPSSSARNETPELCSKFVVSV